jgi:hypothetical protein
MAGVEPVPLDGLVLDDRNARVGNVSAIVDSLREFGQHRPVVVQRGSNRIIAGNHLVMAARTLGWEQIGVFWVDDDDATAIRRGIADNATGDLAKWDDDTLKGLLVEVGNDVPGIDDRLLSRLFKEIEDDSAEPVYPVVPKPGEHYSYVLIVASTTVDEAWMEAAFEIGKAQSYKSQAVRKSRVVTVDKFRELLPEIARTLAVTAEPDE